MISQIRISLLILLLVSSFALRADVVIVSPDVNEQSFNRNFLLAVFSMRVTHWADGKPIRVFVLPDRHPVHYRFVKEHLQIFPYQLRNNWDRQIYTGTGLAPVEVEHIDEMYQRVAETPGAIGYISAIKHPEVMQVRAVDEY